MISRLVAKFQGGSNLKQVETSKRLELTCVAIIFVSSLLLRVLFIGLTEFKYDEADLCWKTLEWLNGGEFPLRGQQTSISTLYHGPITMYLLALPFLIFDPNPESAIFLVAWMNSLTVLFVYITGREMFDYKTGLLAALLMGFAPWAFIYSRKIWPLSYLPFTSAIIIFSLYRAIKDRKPIYFFIGGFAQGISFQLHPTAFLIVPVILALLLVNRCQIYSILLAVLGVLAGYFPMLVYCLFYDRAYIWNYIYIFLHPAQTRPSYYSSKFYYSYAVLRYFLDITGGTGIETTYGRFYPSSLKFLHFFSIEMILIVAYFLWIFNTWFKNFKRKKISMRDSPHFMISLWLMIPLMLHLISGGRIYHHYFVIFYPANFLAIASVMNHFLKNKLRIRLKIDNYSLKIPALGILMALIILFHLLTISTFLCTVRNTGGSGEFGSTLENKKAAVKWIISDKDFYDYRVVVQSNYYHTDEHTYQYLFKIHGKEMSEGEPLHYYYILDMVSNSKAFSLLDEYMGFKVDDCQIFGSIVVIKTSI